MFIFGFLIVFGIFFAALLYLERKWVKEFYARHERRLTMVESDKDMLFVTYQVREGKGGLSSGTAPPPPPPPPQIIANLASACEFRGAPGYPQPFKAIVDAISGIFTLDVLGVLSVDCFERTNFNDKLLLYTLVPLGLGFANVLYQAACKLCGGSFGSGKAFSR